MIARSWWILGLMVACGPAPSNDPAPDPDPTVDEPPATDPTDVVDADNDGFDATVDCNDDDATVFPGATETCNDVDDDCDDDVDEGVTTDFFTDDDADGYGDRDAVAVASCIAPVGTVDNALDCDDTTNAVSPAATETCNSIDDDCDDDIDEGVRIDFYTDADDDGFGDAGATPVAACDAPKGTVDNAMDCDDTTDAVRPGAIEICNGVDDDCVFGIDDGLTFTEWFADVDRDGFGNSATGVNACAAPDGHVADSSDCDDATAAVYPGAPEVCNGIDDDCANGPDDGLTFSDWFADVDGDGFGDAATVVNDCQAPPDHVADDTDCDDARDFVFPGAPELCNGVDDDCANGPDDTITVYPSVNLAVGATASATTTYGGYDVAKLTDGSASTALGSQHSWVNEDGQRTTAEIEIDFGEPTTFGRIDVYSTENYATTGFTIDRWDGTAWAPLTVASGLTSVRSVHTFPTVTTSKIRLSNLEGSVAQTGYARLNEIEVYANQAFDIGTPVASTTYSGYSTADTVDGSRGTSLGDGWTNRLNYLPATVDYDFGECRGFDVFALTTTNNYEVAEFDIEVFDGLAWTTVEVVVDNVDVTVESVVEPMVGEAVRVRVHRGSANQPQHARINEFEIY